MAHDRLPDELPDAITNGTGLMWLSVDLCVVPIGVGVSLSPYVATCEKVIRATGLTHQLGPNGTAIEGHWDAVMDCVRACHDALHAMGAPRIYTTLKLNTRIDREQSFLDKVASVEQQLQG